MRRMLQGHSMAPIQRVLFTFPSTGPTAKNGTAECVQLGGQWAVFLPRAFKQVSTYD